MSSRTLLRATLNITITNAEDMPLMYGPFKYKYNIASFAAGMLLFGIVGYWFGGSDARAFWGGIGGAVGLTLGALLSHPKAGQTAGQRNSPAPPIPQNKSGPG